MALKNEINHVVLVIDESGSMLYHQNTVIKVVDDTIEHLARRSTELEQETRVTIYTFSSGYQAVKCLAYDMDVLRLPSMKNLYKPNGMTALIDATIKAISDLSQTATLYGEHAFLMYVITDGSENSSSNDAAALASNFRNLDSKGNWTYAAFVPNQNSVNLAVNYGFPKDNVIIWDTDSAKGFEAVGTIIRQASDTYMTNRSKGIKSSKNLFQLNTVSSSDILSKLKPLDLYTYSLLAVPYDQRVDDFVYDSTGRKLIVGKAYYQLTKKETIQANKNLAIAHKGRVYYGAKIRQLLGLPADTVDVDPSSTQYADYTLFVQSTALNRKLLKNTSLLLLN